MTRAVPARPDVAGKFFRVGDRRLYPSGVTYGTFAPDSTGSDYPDPDVVRADFEQMARNGMNAVRLYTVPPRWLLDAAERAGLYVLVGLPWEQHVAFLDESDRARWIEERVRDGVRRCAGHPALLGFAVGNEIPASIVRWHGRRKVERFIHRLYRAVKDEDPEALVTYVNYPTTEYLQLPFLDFVCFNVYLETQPALEAYLARLQNIAGDRPLVMAEIGLDSRRNGEAVQATTLGWQLSTTFAAGCAGAFVFAWTDQWHRGGHDIDEWDFGLVRRDREPKEALRVVGGTFAGAPTGDGRATWPRITVVVCSYNGARWIAGCLEALERVEYPDFEVVVVDDGSTDATGEIAAGYRCRVITTENGGLSAARNVGLRAATGEIVAYVDDDARPDPQWLKHLAHSFMTTSYAAVGGPNIPPPGDKAVPACVANAPGGPVHVLLSDTEAEHLPGCNMAVRRASLEAIGGFDPRFRVAGDDVDVCWRLQGQGEKLGFSPGAMVWHHRRDTVRGYLRQQHEYGKAEGMLERKWPERYNRAGHLTWGGRVYGGPVAGLPRKSKVGYGTWGAQLFQSLYQPAPTLLRSLPLTPEWHLVTAALSVVCLLGLLWTPLLAALPVFLLAAGAPLVSSAAAGARASFDSTSTSRPQRLWMRGLTALLHLTQPVVRLAGRLKVGLSPWRRRGIGSFSMPRRQIRTAWTERWHSGDDRLRRVEHRLRARGAVVGRGGDFDRWDLHIRGGLLGAARLQLAVEEHGGGHQLARYRIYPNWSRVGVVLVALFLALATAAALDGAGQVSIILALSGALLALAMVRDAAASTGALRHAVDSTACEAVSEGDLVPVAKHDARSGSDPSRVREDAPEVLHSRG